MIDWVSAALPLLHQPLNGGTVCKILPDSSLEWSTRCAISVVGSHDASIQVKSVGGDGQGKATHLYLHGNPSKFLQGHNIFGSDDLVALVYDTYQKVCKALKLSPQLAELGAVKKGAYSLSRVDINYSYSLPTRSDVNAWLRAAEFKSRTRHGRPALKGGTLYWGKNSRRWALKAYCKGEEIEAPKHRLPDNLLDTKLPEWADNKLRIELVLRAKQLKELGFEEAKTLTVDEIRRVYRSYLERLEMNEQLALTTDQLLEFPQKLRSTYTLWQIGEDLRSTLPKATYYRHRKQLLEYGIDIALRQEAAPRNNVVPLVRVLEAEPAEIPQWAFDEQLVHQSARH
ncbi:phage/plasmid replication protein, II/X family [Motiliproteus sp.]|uniref:phage/plasmid replication protein, II/X family n=1 Tax=Motiliproteus sp. TaxID=1898955 RepID=UPI003BACF4E8